MQAKISVLVVEDEALIRMAIADFLTDRGFDVLEAGDATEAINLLVAHPEVRVMFTDVDMPGGIDGLKLAAAVRDRWPPIAIVVTSGHRTVDADDLPVEARFFPKPYSADQVARALTQMAHRLQ